MANTLAPGAAGMQDLIANFKEVYGELKDLVPNNLKFINLVPFTKGNQMGKGFVEAVVMSLEGGITYGGTAGEAFDLNPYISHTIVEARVQSSEMVLRSAVSVKSLANSQSDKAAFMRTLRLMTGNMLKSMYHRLEVAMLYGQDSIGEVETATPVTGDTSKILVKIKDSEWAAGNWVGTNRHKIDFLSPDLSAKRAAANVVAFALDYIDLDARTITIVGKDALGKDVSNISAADIVANDKIFFYGEVEAGTTPLHLNSIGLKAIAERRGELFGIDNTKNPLFQGNVIVSGTPGTPEYLDFSTIERAAARGVEKGVSDDEMDTMISVDSWNDLLEDQAAKRRYSGNETEKLKEGAKELEFYGQTGTIRIIPSTFVKNGYAFSFCKKDLLRIGVYDVTMTPPGYEDEPITRLENSHGFQIRVQSDQCLFTSKPGSVTVISNLTNQRLSPKV